MLWAASSIPHWGNVCPTSIAHAPHSTLIRPRLPLPLCALPNMARGPSLIGDLPLGGFGR